MKEKQQLIIDFSKFGGPVYSGRAKGELARTKLNLDAHDAQDCQARVIIPERTFSVTSSFFLGLFGKSVRHAGSGDEFLKRYRFKAPEIFEKTIDLFILRALREQTDLVSRSKN